MTARRTAALLGVLLAVSAAPRQPPAQLDSQLVLERYAQRLDGLPVPKNVIFTYIVSQAGPHDLEAEHRIYRSGTLVRDETLAENGQTLKERRIRIARYADRYAINALAPRLADYTFLFLRARLRGTRWMYAYEAVPLVRGEFSVKRMTIDGAAFLPSSVDFTIAGVTGANAHGEFTFARFGPYWMVTSASVSATIDGKPAREHISFSDYRFPATLPASTF